jgi:hypothetical protein
MYFEKNIMNLIYSFDNTYHIIFKETLNQINNLKPYKIIYGVPSMYKVITENGKQVIEFRKKYGLGPAY